MRGKKSPNLPRWPGNVTTNSNSILNWVLLLSMKTIGQILYFGFFVAPFLLCCIIVGYFDKELEEWKQK